MCSLGYTGELCAKCLPSFFRPGSSLECVECGSEAAAIASVVVSGVFMVLIIVAMVYKTLRDALTPKQQYSILMKITLNMTQAKTPPCKNAQLLESLLSVATQTTFSPKHLNSKLVI